MGTARTQRVSVLAATLGPLLSVHSVHADIDPISGIDLVTVGAVGNAPWSGGGTSNGRGQVNYEYRIGKYEVTTAQWAEFMNAAFDRPTGDAIPWIQTPFIWGGVNTTPTNPSNPSARRWIVPVANEMLPAGGISWRTAAIYCNWLTNGKSTNREAFLDGAYDVSTFAYTPGGEFLDQLTHHPGAAYYIPTYDEMLKAGHYDPNKPNQDGTTGGWWTYNNGSNSFSTPGPPGIGMANFFWTSAQYPGHNPYTVPLGAYNVTSPWGLYDMAGGTFEWTEEPVVLTSSGVPHDRRWDGSYWGGGGMGGNLDHINGQGGEFPGYSGSDAGFRIAAVLPAPCTFLLVAGGTWFTMVRRRQTSASTAGGTGCDITDRATCSAGALTGGACGSRA